MRGRKNEGEPPSMLPKEIDLELSSDGDLTKTFAKEGGTPPGKNINAQTAQYAVRRKNFDEDPSTFPSIN